MHDHHLKLVTPDQQVYTPARPKRAITRILVDKGLVRATEVLAAYEPQHDRQSDIIRRLRMQTGLSDVDLYPVLAEHEDLPYLQPAEVAPDRALLDRLNPALCLRHKTIPIQSDGPDKLYATSRPDLFDSFCDRLPASALPARLSIAQPHTIEEALLAHSSARLATQAEHLVPEHQSCRSLPQYLPKLTTRLTGFAVLIVAFFGLSPLQIITAVFFCAAALLIVGMVLKASALLTLLFFGKRRFAGHRRPPPHLPMISLLVPLHDESDILDHLLARLERLDYPRDRLDVLIITEHADLATRNHLSSRPLPRWIRVITVPSGQITTKPRAMNYALPFCEGEIIGIYDAEDAPEADQLRKVAAIFANTPEKTACIQGILGFYNSTSNLLARFFAIEYATLFRLILPGLSQMGFAIPLGGTTVFLRRHALEQVYGWDAHNVTEDADLGIRLARHGFETVLMDSTTHEEANNRPWPWVKQRSRWLKGYLVTYLTHMRQPLRLLADLGLWKFIGFQAFFLSSLSQFLLAPAIWACLLLHFTPPEYFSSHVQDRNAIYLFAFFTSLWVLGTLIHACALTKEERWTLLPYVPFISIYLMLGTAAIYKGVWELAKKPFYWDKTVHGHSVHAAEQ